jgi:hypothetical protein
MQVQQASGRGDEDVDAAAERGDLRAFGRRRRSRWRRSQAGVAGE